MTEPPPKRRWFSRSPNASIIVEVGDASLRVGRETQRAVRRAAVMLLVKYVLPIVVAGAAALIAYLEC